MLPPADTAGESDTKPKLLPPPPPLDGFVAEEFKSRREALRAAYPNGIVLIRGATEDEVPHGMAVRYRQNSAFFYLTGVDTPGAVLVMLPEDVTASSGLRNVASDIREVLFLPNRDATVETWTGPKLGPGEDTEKATGIAKALDLGKLWQALPAWLRRDPVLHTLTPWGEQSRGTREYALMRRIADVAPAVQFRDASAVLWKQRAVKSPAEIERLRAANAVTAEGQRAARAAIAGGAGRREFEIEARVFEAFRARGAVPAFATIVGAAVNGTTLHYEDNTAELRNGDLVVVDIGARIRHYCGDITRTYPVGGKFSPRQREVYELVLAAHERAVAGYRPGEDSLEDMDKRCKEFLKESPLKSKDTEGKEKTMDVFMPHGLGHDLGLDVHDVVDRERLLAPGHVVTVEPGVYLPSEGIGVRIEDDYLVTASGLEPLNSPMKKTVEEIEAAMAMEL